MPRLQLVSPQVPTLDPGTPQPVWPGSWRRLLRLLVVSRRSPAPAEVVETLQSTSRDPIRTLTDPRDIHLA